MSLVISSREFRSQQGKYLDMAETGQVFIKRRRRFFLISPVDQGDIIISPQMVEKMKKAEKDFTNGKATRITPDSWKTTTLKSPIEVFKAEPRQGWAESFKQFSLSGEEETFFPDVFNDEDLSEVAWEK